MTAKSLIPSIILLLSFMDVYKADIPIVLHTWNFPAAQKVWSVMKDHPISAVDAVVLGCSTCEELQCEHTVGFGGSPDENGETTLDALIFDGTTMDMGAVASLRRVKNAIEVARLVLEHTQHSMLAGYSATQFAKNFQLKETNLATNYSIGVFEQWREHSCQPNFWKNVEPDPKSSCGPYRATLTNEIPEYGDQFSSTNHDTIGMIAIDQQGNVVAGTSTNGANHKIPGRVGDSPIPGAGAYADSKYGAAVATGDGDVMMRFLPSFLAVEELRRGSTPEKAAQIAIQRIVDKYPQFFGAVLVATNKGEFAAACNGMATFPFFVASQAYGGAVLQTIPCQ